MRRIHLVMLPAAVGGFGSCAVSRPMLSLQHIDCPPSDMLFGNPQEQTRMLLSEALVYLFLVLSLLLKIRRCTEAATRWCC